MEKKVSKERILDDMAHASEQVRMECLCDLLRGLIEKPFMLRAIRSVAL